MSLIVIPAVWLAHFLFVYVLVSLACRLAVPGIVAPGAALATLAALALFFWAGAHDRRRSGREEHAFFAQASLPLCALGAIASLWVAWPAFVLQPCVT